MAEIHDAGEAREWAAGIDAARATHSLPQGLTMSALAALKRDCETGQRHILMPKELAVDLYSQLAWAYELTHERYSCLLRQHCADMQDSPRDLIALEAAGLAPAIDHLIEMLDIAEKLLVALLDRAKAG